MNEIFQYVFFLFKDVYFMYLIFVFKDVIFMFKDVFSGTHLP